MAALLNVLVPLTVTTPLTPEALLVVNVPPDDNVKAPAPLMVVVFRVKLPLPETLKVAPLGTVILIPGFKSRNKLMVVVPPITIVVFDPKVNVPVPLIFCEVPFKLRLLALAGEKPNV